MGTLLRRLTRLLVVTAAALAVLGSDCDDDDPPVTPSPTHEVTVLGRGTGAGNVFSRVVGGATHEINCDIVAGTTSGSCTRSFVEDRTVTLEPTPATGSSFVAFSGSCAVSTCELFIQGDKTVTVQFDLIPPPPGTVPSDTIVFESFRDMNREIYVIKPDGTGLKRRTTNSGQDRDPVWSPDRTKIAFVTDRAPHPGNEEIYVMNADGTNPVRLTNDAGEDRRPAYSPDGTKIAFDSDRDGDEEIFVMNADGTGVPTQLTVNDIKFDQGPSWNLDGTKILFTSFRDGRDNLYVMDADGKNQTLLVDTGNDDFQPDWSPDGLRIVFTSQDAGGDDEIFVVDADGTSNLKQLTFNTVADREATWSKDSKWIAFASDQGAPKNFDIYIMTPDGMNMMRVTLDPADDQRPSWVH